MEPIEKDKRLDEESVTWPQTIDLIASQYGWGIDTILDLSYERIELLLKAIGIRRHNQLLQDARTPHLDLEKLPKPLRWKVEKEGGVTEEQRRELRERWLRGEKVVYGR